MLAVEICGKCKSLDDRSDMPNLWCNKIGDLINGCTMSELAEAGCIKMKTILALTALLNEDMEDGVAEDVVQSLLAKYEDEMNIQDENTNENIDEVEYEQEF